MSTIKAVLFDFGGTLFTYVRFVAAGPRNAAKLAELLGMDAGDDVAEAYAEGRRRSAEEYMRLPYYLHRDMGVAGAVYAAKALGTSLSAAGAHEFFEFRMEGMGQDIVPRPGMRETLSVLRERGLHVGGASNSDINQFAMMVNALDVRDSFDSLMCSEDAQSCKPDGAFFHMALENAGCRPEEAVYIGDTPMADIAGGNSAGMYTVLIEETSALGIDRGQPGEEDAFIRELPELLAFVDSL